MSWPGPIGTVLVVKKWNDQASHDALLEVMSFLKNYYNLKVLVDPNDPSLTGRKEFSFFEKNVSPKPDLLVSLGGDGTILRAVSWLGSTPPVVAFALGSLGFLTPYSVKEYVDILTKIIKFAADSRPSADNDLLYCTLRSRLKCEVFDVRGELVADRLALNECLVARGAGTALLKWENFSFQET
jgi:NAD+ kinase